MSTVPGHGDSSSLSPAPVRLSIFDWLRRNRTFAATLGAFIVPLGLAAALVPWRTSFSSSGAAIAMIVVIVGAGVVGNRVAGLVASLSSALWFDFFLVPPFERVTISHRPDIETTICMLIAGVIVTELAARSRHHFKASNEAVDYVSMLREVVELGASTRPIGELIDAATSSLTNLLGLRRCRYEATCPGPQLARILATGEVVHVGLHWPVDEIGIPGPEAEIPVEWRGKSMGRFVVTPTPGEPVALERRIVAVTLATVVAGALHEERGVS